MSFFSVLFCCLILGLCHWHAPNRCYTEKKALFYLALSVNFSWPCCKLQRDIARGIFQASQWLYGDSSPLQLESLTQWFSWNCPKSIPDSIGPTTMQSAVHVSSSCHHRTLHSDKAHIQTHLSVNCSWWALKDERIALHSSTSNIILKVKCTVKCTFCDYFVPV